MNHHRGSVALRLVDPAQSIQPGDLFVLSVCVACFVESYITRGGISGNCLLPDFGCCLLLECHVGFPCRKWRAAEKLAMSTLSQKVPSYLPGNSGNKVKKLDVDLPEFYSCSRLWRPKCPSIRTACVPGALSHHERGYRETELLVLGSCPSRRSVVKERAVRSEQGGHAAPEYILAIGPTTTNSLP